MDWHSSYSKFRQDYKMYILGPKLPFTTKLPRLASIAAAPLAPVVVDLATTSHFSPSNADRWSAIEDSVSSANQGIDGHPLHLHQNDSGQHQHQHQHTKIHGTRA